MSSALKPFVLGFAACAALSLVVAAGLRTHQPPGGPPDPTELKPVKPAAPADVKPAHPQPESDDMGEDPKPDMMGLTAKAHKAIRKAIADPTYKITDVSSEQADGVTLYVVTGTHGTGETSTTTVTAEGCILESDVTAKEAEMPDELIAAIKAQHPAAVMAEAQRSRSLSYMMWFKDAGKTFVASLDPDNGITIEEDPDAPHGDDKAKPDAKPDAKGGEPKPGAPHF